MTEVSHVYQPGNHDVISQVLNMVTRTSGGYKWTNLIHECGLEGNDNGICNGHGLVSSQVLPGM